MFRAAGKRLFRNGKIRRQTFFRERTFLFQDWTVVQPREARADSPDPLKQIKEKDNSMSQEEWREKVNNQTNLY